MLTATEIRQIVEEVVTNLPAVHGVLLASALRVTHVELLVILGTGAQSRRALLTVSRENRGELERSLHEALRRVTLGPSD